VSFCEQSVPCTSCLGLSATERNLKSRAGSTMDRSGTGQVPWTSLVCCKWGVLPRWRSGPDSHFIPLDEARGGRWRSHRHRGVCHRGRDMNVNRRILMPLLPHLWFHRQAPERPALYLTVGEDDQEIRDLHANKGANQAGKNLPHQNKIESILG